MKHNQTGDRVYMELYCALRENASWRDRFADRYAALLCTDLSVDPLTALLDKMAAALRPKMARHITRWKKPSTVAAREANNASLRCNIACRHTVIGQQVINLLGLTKAQWMAHPERYQ